MDRIDLLGAHLDERGRQRIGGGRIRRKNGHARVLGRGTAGPRIEKVVIASGWVEAKPARRRSRDGALEEREAGDDRAGSRGVGDADRP